MHLLPCFLAAVSHWAVTHARDTEQVVLDNSLPRKATVAIVGAGAAGASTAYHLSKFAAAAHIPVNITVFERSDYIGGRCTTVDAYGDPRYPVELGASIFVEVNSILVNATKAFNLSTDPLLSQSRIPGAALAVWDGKAFVITQNGQSWWDIAKLLWKYGLAPVKTMNLVKTVVGNFLNMYDKAFPFVSLTQVTQDLGLLAVTAATGTQYLEENGITGEFGREVVQASTRVNYAQNLDYIHGLEAMVSMAADNARSVQNGNWQIFAGMIDSSNATTLLNTAVTDIEKMKNGDYTLRFDRLGSGSVEKFSKETFDTVVLAGPYQHSNINALHTISMPEPVPYVELHVTLFTSPHLLSPKFFNLPEDKAAPHVILTTLPKDEKVHTGPEGVGSPAFFSISLLRAVTNPVTGAEEYCYKVFSASPPSATFLKNLLGLRGSSIDDESKEISEKDITWMLRKVWDSYPYEYPRVTFEKIEVDDRLWYTGGMDSFISTMETNALMGMNVARLIVDQWMRNVQTSAE